MKIAKILVQGIVQGVGFRPTVYRIATALNLKGYVRNLGNIVEIILFEDEKKTKKFITTLKKEKPPISTINSIQLQWTEESKYPYPKNNKFKIIESSSNYSGSSIIPSDIDICNTCLKEINNPKNRRYKYPFTTCTECGPRFTIIKDIPYDRDNITMNNFSFCQNCEKEYNNPSNRRYHSETNCCEVCGPSLKLYNHEKKEIKTPNPLEKAAKLLNKEKILAIKGIGGTHLVCKTTNSKPIETLRKRLNRPNQPFAIMSPNLDTVKTFAKLSSKETTTLSSKEKPIVILKKKEEKNYNFAENLAPGLHNIGVMLPYSPLHHLLFNYTDETAYVMTSANTPGEPMMIKNKEILSKLHGITDYYLLHNRTIINRCDDSVIRYRNNELSFIRRSRGYTPKPYDLKKLIETKKTINKNLNILALGPELDVTFTLAKQGLAYVSQHIGNTKKFKTYQFLQKAITNMMNITKTKKFDAIACDMHPQFFTHRLANEIGEKFNCNVIPIQHHHAHGTALAIDNSLDELVFIAADGVGYGEDGTTWGGEIMYTDIANYKRLASLEPQKIPGGDISTKYPTRILASILHNSPQYTNENHEELEKLLNKNYSHYFQHGEIEIKNVLKQIETNLNIGISTSTGRILDSIAAALKICGENTYEGECPMKLESFANNAKRNISIKPTFKKINKRPVLDTTNILSNIMELITEGKNKKEIAIAGQKAISEGLAKLAVDAADNIGIDVIGATGGVFYNETITLATKEYIEKKGFKFIQHKNTCAGDGSISLGQATIAYSKMK